MRKVIMGVGAFVAVVGLIQLILSVALIGPVRARVPEVDRTIDDAAGALTKVADATDRGVDFLAELDPELAKLEKTIGDTIDDSVGRLGDLDDSLAVAERALAATLDDSLKYLGELGATLAAMDETVTEIKDGMILARDSITERLEQLVVEIRAEDLDRLVASVDTVLADAEKTVADMTAGVESAKDITRELLEQVVLGIWPEDLIAWAEQIEALVGWDAGLLRDWAAFIGPAGWRLFPLEASPEELQPIAVLLEGAGWDATWLRAEADRLAREGLILSLTPEEIAGVFTLAIENLELVSASLADASGWLRYWPEFLERLEREDVTLRLFPVEITAEDIDVWADQIEAAGLDATWLRAEADRLRREGLMWSLTPQDFALAFTPVIDSLELALATLSDTSNYLGTLGASLEEAREPTIQGISETRELLGTARTSLGDLKTPVLDGIASTRGYLQTAQADLGGLGEDLRRTSGNIVGLGIGEMMGRMIGWLQTFMILMSILFMAAGAGLFLLGMKKEES
ncbi:hypothetical protein M1N44_03515 [Dehalococcoidia bacterium]|nr:hypothetical protein [Dehalococcoidia bacterium]